ncbi:TPA: hypothetical protein HH840_005005 [Escherichia coli]|nr:hypothetical protein [Escherichia coli]
MHHLIFTVLTLTGFRGVLNYRSTTQRKRRICSVVKYLSKNMIKVKNV